MRAAGADPRVGFPDNRRANGLPSHPSSKRDGMKKILLIDDEPTVVEAISTLLRSSGYEVVAAVDGLNGLKLAKSEQPDLILCDLVMSPIDGFMTLSILRQQADTSHIPFAIVSGKREAQDVRRGMLLGADEYITKPFEAEELLAAVAKMVEARDQTLQTAGILIRDLRMQVGAASETHVTETLDRVLTSTSKLRGLVPEGNEDEANEHEREIGAGLETLTRAIANSRLLTQIEKIAANADAMRLLPEAETSEFHSLVEGECRRLSRMAGRANDLTLDLASGKVRIGSSILTRVIEELIRNALRFSPVGSEISVKARHIDQSVQLDITNESTTDLSGHTTIQMRREDFEAVLPVEFNHGCGLKVAHNLIALHGGQLTIRRPGVRRVCIHLNLPA